jgi:hypothetical protein
MSCSVNLVPAQMMSKTSKLWMTTELAKPPPTRTVARGMLAFGYRFMGLLGG